MKHLQLTDDLQEQASLYVAGALPERERVEYVRHLEEDRCTVCVAEVHELQDVMTQVALIVPTATPSLAVKVRLIEQARRVDAAPRQSFLRRRWLELVTSSAAIVAIIGMLAVMQSNRELRRLADTLVSRIAQLEVELSGERTHLATLTSPNTRLVNLAGQGTNVSASAKVFWDQPQKKWLFYVRDLPRLADDVVYQLWFVPKTGNPISAAVFKTETNGSYETEIELPEGATDLKAAAVTTEPGPNGLAQPSGSFVLLGAAE